jgi:cytochrome P450
LAVTDRAPLELDSIDLSAVDFWRRPWSERLEAYRILRDERPVAFFEEPEPLPSTGAVKGAGYWAVTRHADVLEVSRRPGVFTSGQGALGVTDATPEINEFFGSLISMDDPRHARLRKIVSGAFTPKVLAHILDQVEQTAVSVVDAVVERGSVDLVADLAAPFPLLVILDMMGIPRRDAGTVLRSANAILSGGDPDFLPPGKDFGTALIEAGVDLVALIEPLAAARRADPTDDLTSALVHAEVDGERITDQELASFFILLCVAGSETTRTAVSHGVWALEQHPDQRAAWMTDFDAMASTAVDEIVRWSTPVISMRRTLSESFRLEDVELSEGDKVLIMYSAANRDERAFDQPERFDLSRHPNPHVGFGGPGPHFCLGAHLARREITVMFRELFRRLPDLTVTGPPAPLESSFINGIKRLPVTFTPHAPTGA